ncbi:site-specific integrase [uncultured Tenacibaculum sp.]|uniref:site-specific integrase n=1 Tax=uncultured Tenacibaculum sp. TaxID=174713 RepID=UPI0026202DBD|nr:site-specific integrase [uncultured Tenacibaculum sp.]
MRTSKTFSIHFWLKKSAEKSNGKIPIYARITVDGIRADVSTKRCTLPHYWISKANRINPRISGAKVINQYLDDVYTKLIDCHKQLHIENKLITAQAIKLRYLGTDKEVTTLKELLDYHFKNELPKLEPGTAKNYGATEKYLLKFLTKKLRISDVKLATIDYSFITSFENYLRACKPLRASQPLTNNGIMKHQERFQKILNIAMKFSWIQHNPFVLYQLKFDEYDSHFLEANELEIFKNLTFEDSGLQLVCDIFVFACYTGLSYIEVKLLKKDGIVTGIDGEQWINVTRKKTKTPVKVPLLDDAKRILDKYTEYPNVNNNYSLLPVYTNQVVNRYLKTITEIAKIHKHITFHVARHTFATTVTLLNNVPLETVSKLLGHTKLSTTQRYARVVEKKISNDFGKLKDILKANMKQNCSYKTTPYNHLQIVK